MSSDEKSPVKAEVSCGDWSQVRNPVRRRFPGPEGAQAFLRTAFSREAWAEVVQHAKESLQAEICGVLVGRVCRDDAGLWVDVAAVVRGQTAAKGSAHVTFTHETWTRIHEERERNHPDLAIVGWYHSHPGFGVEFSEMDTFIQRNFFAGQAQLALVTDPLAGSDAICVNGPDGIAYLERCWIDGRERNLVAPSSGKEAASTAVGAGQGRIDQLEARVAQLVASLDDMRNRVWSFYLFIGLLVAMVAILWIGWQIWQSWARRLDPPEVVNELSVPVQIGDKRIIMLAKVYGWKVPDELNALLIEQMRLEVEARLKAEQAAKAAASATAPAAGGETPPKP